MITPPVDGLTFVKNYECHSAEKVISIQWHREKSAYEWLVYSAHNEDDIAIERGPKGYKCMDHALRDALIHVTS